jgi:hypothetical protein
MASTARRTPGSSRSSRGNESLNVSTTVSQRLGLIWLLGSVLAVLVALASRDAAFIAGHYIPVGNDSFYHARRILDLVADPTSLHEFDRFIHYPEGSLLIWPWGYDYFMSLLVRLGLALHLGADGITVLVHIPVFAFPICIALVVVICHQLKVSLAGTAVAALATVFFPLNQGLYGIGNIDHHFAEQVLVLGSLAFGLMWLGKPESKVRAIALGTLMGASLCIHNGLFIIQFPVVAVFLWQWIRHRPIPRTALPFAIALSAATLLAAAPSTAFRTGEFQFYELSWFHIYFSVCVGATCVFVSRFSASTRNIVVLVSAIVLALIPVISQLLLANRFLSVNVEGAEQIAEVQSVWGVASSRQSIRAITSLYSFLVLALPFALVVSAVRAWTSDNAQRTLFWITSLFGLVLLAMMVRLHVFGSFALYLVWIVFLDELAAAGRLQPTLFKPALGLLAVAACGTGIPAALAPKITSNDPYYALTYDIYPFLERECAKTPGVVLSNLDDANYVRYHTGCTVIANNFLLTAFHEQKVRQARALFETPASDVATRAPYVKYVLVHRQSLWTMDPGGRIRFSPAGDPGTPDPRLVTDLVSADPAKLPPHFRLVKELSFEKPEHVVYARLFAIDPAQGTDPTS